MSHTTGGTLNVEPFGIGLRLRSIETRVLLPHEVEAGGLVEELGGVGEEAVGVVGEGCEEAFFVAGGPGDGGLSLDAGVACGVDEGDAEAADLVDEAEGEGLLAGPDLAGGERTDLVVGGVAAEGDVVDELAVH